MSGDWMEPKLPPAHSTLSMYSISSSYPLQYISITFHTNEIGQLLNYYRPMMLCGVRVGPRPSHHDMTHSLGCRLPILVGQGNILYRYMIAERQPSYLSAGCVDNMFKDSSQVLCTLQDRDA